MATDEELLGKARGGDIDAMRQLVVRYAGLVYVIARGILRDHGLAEDCAQETFVKVWRQISRIESFKPYVWKTATTTALDYKKRRPKDVMPVDPDLIPARERESLEALEQKARMLKELSRCLATLPEEEHVVVRCWREGMSWKEIENSMGLTVGSCRYIFVKAIKQLRECLEARMQERTCGPGRQERPGLRDGSCGCEGGGPVQTEGA